MQTDFTHVIGCVIPCVSPFTPYGLAPYAGVGDGSMDLAIVPRISRCANLRFMRKVAMHGGRSVLAMSNTLNVFRVTRWAFTPAALLHAQGAFKNSVGFRDNQGSWNLDGGILYSFYHYLCLYKAHSTIKRIMNFTRYFLLAQRHSCQTHPIFFASCKVLWTTIQMYIHRQTTGFINLSSDAVKAM